MKPSVKLKRSFDRSCNGGDRKHTKQGYARAVRRESRKLSQP